MAKRAKKSVVTGGMGGAAPEIMGAEPTPLPELPKPEEKETRSDEIGFRGGISIKIDKIKDKLASDVARWLDAERENQRGRIDKLETWNRQYNGIKPEKSYPYVGCNNTSIPITMYHADAITVRLHDAIFGQKKAFILRGKKQPFIDMVPALEDGLEWWQKNIAVLRRKLFSPLLQGTKTGTGVVKLDYVRKKRTVYRYADGIEREMLENGGKIEGAFKLSNGEWGVKQIITDYDGPDVFPISREDWVISSDATTIQDAFMCGFRTYLRKPEIEAKIKQKLYYKDVLDKMTAGDDTDKTKQDRAESAKKEIGKGDTPDKFEIWELWLRYDVDNDGEEDDIVVTFHPATKTILRAIYNPFFMGFRPFVALRFNPAEYQFDGKGVCEILEKVQEEIDTVHNQRLDRMDQINAQIFIVRRGTGLDEFKVSPGNVWLTEDDPERVIFPLRMPEVYPSTFQEESLLNNYAERIVASPQSLGQSVSERPVAKETLALLQEMNKKFKFGIDNIRADVAEIGRMALEMFAQYRPKYEYFVDTEGKYEQKTIEFPLELLRDGITVDLAASSELLNTEVRREINLTLYQLLSDYMTKTASMAQAILNPGMPPDFKKFLVTSCKIGEKLLGRIVEDFGGWEAQDLVAPIEASINIQAAMAPPPPQPSGPMGGPPPRPGMPPSGPRPVGPPMMPGPGGPPPNMPMGPPPQIGR